MERGSSVIQVLSFSLSVSLMAVSGAIFNTFAPFPRKKDLKDPEQEWDCSVNESRRAVEFQGRGDA